MNISSHNLMTSCLFLKVTFSHIMLCILVGFSFHKEFHSCFPYLSVQVLPWLLPPCAEKLSDLNFGVAVCVLLIYNIIVLPFKWCVCLFLSFICFVKAHNNLQAVSLATFPQIHSIRFNKTASLPKHLLDWLLPHPSLLYHIIERGLIR